MESKVSAGSGFGSDVNSGCWIVSNQHNRQAWGDSFCFECGGFAAAFFEDGGGNGFAVNDVRLIHAGGV